MAQTILPSARDHEHNRYGTVAVELSDRRLPVHMRMGGARSRMRTGGFRSATSGRRAMLALASTMMLVLTSLRRKTP